VVARYRTDNRPHFRPQSIFKAALAYRRAGLSFIPISSNGSKMPAFELLPRSQDAAGVFKRRWSPYRLRCPNRDEIEHWLKTPRYRDQAGIAILAGQVSSNLEIVDFDNADSFVRWQTLMLESGAEFLEKIVWIRSPRPGVHGYYRCVEIGRSQKLASRLVNSAGESEVKVLIETKGEGGYCLAPPSPGDCHPTGREYRYLTGRDLTMITEISVAERELMLSTARSLDELPPKPDRAPTHSRMGLRELLGTRPSDLFNTTVAWADILEPHGWSYQGEGSDGCEYWTRPGKREGTGASVNYGGNDLLRVFTSSAAPLESERSYSKFAAYACLNYDGDWSLAARNMKVDFPELDDSLPFCPPPTIGDLLRG
jgi:putative DNA primase/helicase